MQERAIVTDADADADADADVDVDAGGECGRMAWCGTGVIGLAAHFLPVFLLPTLRILLHGLLRHDDVGLRCEADRTK